MDIWYKNNKHWIKLSYIGWDIHIKEQQPWPDYIYYFVGWDFLVGLSGDVLVFDFFGECEDVRGRVVTGSSMVSSNGEVGLFCR